MQGPDFTDLIAWILIILGCVLIISGIASILLRSNVEGMNHRRESKGVILLGPIPIVWGYGKRGWVVAAIVAITLFFIILLWRF